MDLTSRMPLSKPFFFDMDPPELPLKLGHRSDQNSTWEEIIVALLNCGHIWEANTLLAIHLRHARPTELDLLRILDAVPDENDTMYDLVRLAMLVGSSRSLFRRSWRTLMASTVFDRCEKCAQKLHLCAMDGISDPMNSSRAYQDFRLLSLRIQSTRLRNPRRDLPSRLEPWEVQRSSDDVLQSILDQGDYMLLLAGHEQLAYPIPVELLLQYTGGSRVSFAELHPSAILSRTIPAPLSEAMTLNSGPPSLQHVM
jgi:hypothetical protein